MWEIVVRWQQDKNGMGAREDVEEDPVVPTGEGKRLKQNIWEGSIEGKMGTVLEFSL